MTKVDSSLTRMLATLDLFSASTPSLTVDQIASLLGVPKTTGYRYVQELCKAGLLIRLDRSITLGPRIITLDRSIRESDPVLKAATPDMRALAAETALDVFISRIYGHSVITIHTESTEPGPPLRYGRGRPIPLLKGASAKALMAFLPAARLRRLFSEINGGDLEGWDAFYEEAQQIRKAGYCRTVGELNAGKTGMAAPLYGRGRNVIASITLLGDDARMALFNEERLASRLIETADAISARIAEDMHL